MSDTRREDAGLEDRYVVERRSDPSGKHATCRYFVLDPQHDAHAVTAIRAYSAAVRSEHPGLADDLDAWVGAPVSDARREDVARAMYVLNVRRYGWTNPLDWAEVHESRREEYLGYADVALAVLPAPPVVDAAEIQDIIREAYDTHIDLGSPARRGELVFTAAEVIAARLRGATRG
ncbi:hypothetical protein [Oerskovia paurometabola]|uniref:hypothetical protein n=1 Tax=Oerskovia paurometabola TaxID=162170 RepID=UPI003436E835